MFEILVAAHCNLPVLGLSLITNEGVGPGEDKPRPTHEEVLKVTETATTAMQALVARVIAKAPTATMPAPMAAKAFASTSLATAGRAAVASLTRGPSVPTEGTAMASFRLRDSGAAPSLMVVAAVAVVAGLVGGVLGASLSRRMGWGLGGK